MKRAVFYASLPVLVLMASAAFAQEATKVEVGSAQEFPESVTSTNDGTLFVGSITQGTVLKAAAGAAAVEPFIAKPTEGPSSVLGVYADEANGNLWVCYADMAAFAGAESAPSVLRSYDLASGAEKSAYTFDGTSFCNDIATTADGTAYAADTIASRVVRVNGNKLEDWATGEGLAGVDGLSFGPDGHLYVNSVTANKLIRIDVGADGASGAMTELKLSEEIKGPDGMRFGDDGVLYLAENAAGRVDAVTIDGDTATISPIASEVFDFPTAVTKAGNTLWVLEAKIGKLGGAEDPGTFYVHPLALD